MNQEEKQRNYEIAEALLSEQKFVPALIAGAVATILAAIAYSLVVTRWSFSQKDRYHVLSNSLWAHSI